MSAATNAPSSDYRRHHPVEAPRIDDAHFRQAWRRVDRVEKLCTAGLITPRELQAALAFRTLYERAHAGPGGLGARRWDGVTIDRHCRRPVPVMSERQADALARLHAIKKALGALYTLLELTVVEELPWTAIARRLRVKDPRTARSYVCAALSALAQA